MITVPSPVFPEAARILNVGRETEAYGTLATSYVSVPVNDFQPDPNYNYFFDNGERGSLTGPYDAEQGPAWLESSITESPVYGDTIGYFLAALFGEWSDTGTSQDTTWTAPDGVTAGADSITVTSGTVATEGTYVQVGSGSSAEVCTVGSSSTDTSIVLSTPTRFAHTGSTTITLVASPFCVDEKTEILTEDGWKTVHDLRQGDSVLTYNHETGMAEWQPALEVCVFPAERRELILMEGAGHSSLTTPNHRWSVTNRYGKREWKTTETLSYGDRVPAGAMLADLPAEAKYSDAFVELVAWFWTEGTVRPSGGIVICQANKNADNIERIAASLRGVFGAPSEGLLSRNRWQPTPAAWRQFTDPEKRGRNERFALSATAGKVLTDVAPDRVVSREFLRSLTQAQLDLFIKVSMLADNCGPTRLSQSSRERCEAFQFAATLAGYPTSLLERKTGGTGRYAGRPFWVVTLMKRRWITPVDSAHIAERQKCENGWRMQRVEHDGIVWCPRTPNMTWFARRNGQCYFTGNTHVFATMNPGSPTGSNSGQGPSLSVIDRNFIAGSDGYYGDAYPYTVAQEMTLTGQPNGYLTWAGKLMSWPQVSPGATVTPAFSGTKGIPAWKGTSTIAGSSVSNVDQWKITVTREVNAIPAINGQQAPLVFALGKLTGTFDNEYAAVSDESALNFMLQNTQPSLLWATSNGLSGSSELSFSLAADLGAATKAPLKVVKTLFGYDLTGTLVANSTDVGPSGGFGVATITIVNAVPSY